MLPKLLPNQPGIAIPGLHVSLAFTALIRIFSLFFSGSSVSSETNKLGDFESSVTSFASRGEEFDWGNLCCSSLDSKIKFLLRFARSSSVKGVDIRRRGSEFQS